LSAIFLAFAFGVLFYWLAIVPYKTNLKMIALEIKNGRFRKHLRHEAEKTNQEASEQADYLLIVALILLVTGLILLVMFRSLPVAAYVAGMNL